MHSNHKIALSLVLVIVILIMVPPVAVWQHYSASLLFAPSVFITEYLKFTFNLLSILFGFLLVNVFWERKLGEDRTKSLRRLLVAHLGNMGALVWNTGILLDRHISDAQESLRRDQEIYANICRLKDAVASVEIVSREIIPTKDENLLSELLVLTTEIAPEIQKLHKLVTSGAGGNSLQKDIKTIGTGIHSMLERLRVKGELANESNTTGR